MLDTFKCGGWRAAIAWGIGIALAHRLLLMAWMAGVWLFMGQYLADADVNFHDPGGELPALTTRADQLVFGVWRRWDAIHYYRLALYGYNGIDPDRAIFFIPPSFTALRNQLPGGIDPGATVFGVLTPLGFIAFDRLLPGGIDLGALVFETCAFALMLALLYRVCEIYYADAELAPWAVIVTALLPLSYWFSAPMSESIYLAMVLGVFYFGAKKRWLWAAVCGALATLARAQGVLLVGVVGLLLLEPYPVAQWKNRIVPALRSGWALILIALALVGFEVFRRLMGLPSLSETYNRFSFNYFANPLEGLLINLRWFVTDLGEVLRTPDLPALALMLILALVMLRFPKHRKPALVGYTWVYIFLFVSRINYWYNSAELMYTQSLARYSLALFPLTVLVADGIRHLPYLGRILAIVVLALSAAAFSALYVLALTGP